MASRTLYDFFGQAGSGPQAEPKPNRLAAASRRIKTYGTRKYVHQGPLITSFIQPTGSKNPSATVQQTCENQSLSEPVGVLPKITEHSGKLHARGLAEFSKQPFAQLHIARLAWDAFQIDPSVPWWGNKIFPDRIEFMRAFHELSPRVASGLLPALLSSSPPGMDFWKRLPGETTNRWAVYAILMEKDEEIPEVYTGSATEMKGGLNARWACYDKQGAATPVGVLEAMFRGFQITHKGILLDIPRPQVDSVPKARFLTKILEATMSFAFWTMAERDEDAYGMQSLRLWRLTDFPYRGLCSHSSMGEGSSIQVNLSPEELVERAANAQRYILEGQKRRDRQRAKRNKGKFICPVCGIAMSRKANLKVHMAVHSDKRFFCPQPGCSKSYKRKDKLKKHREKFNH